LARCESELCYSKVGKTKRFVLSFSDCGSIILLMRPKYIDLVDLVFAISFMIECVPKYFDRH